MNKANNDEVTPFFIACVNGHIDIVKRLLNNKRVDINQALNRDVSTLLFIACENGYIDIVKHILGRDVNLNVNCKDYKGMTSIDIVREKGKMEVAEYWENDIEFQERKRNYGMIVELLESFERNPNETRTKLKIELGLAGKYFYYFFFLFFFKKIILNS